MGIKRIINRAFEEIKATKQIAKYTSFYEALMTFIAKIEIQIIARNGKKERKIYKKHLLRKHKIMLKYFENFFGDYLKNYKLDLTSIENKVDMSDTVWMCWWQGENNAPELVKACINSVRKNIGTKKLIVLDEENYKKFIELPYWVEQKKIDGVITRTHFSDLCRLYILSNYGGMWLDATFYCCESIEKYFQYPLWSIKRPDYFHVSVACGKFATYSLRCCYEKRWVFKIIFDLYLHYWETHQSQIDYLTLDYMFVLAQIINSDAKQEFEQIKSNNPNCDELLKIINSRYNHQYWAEIKSNTQLFKLSWKIKIKKGKVESFYDKIINNELN